MALVTNVNIGITNNTAGIVGGTGTVLPIAKSFAYDEAQYSQTDPVALTLSQTIGTAGGTATFGGTATGYVPAFTGKQVRSITVIPVVAETANDFIQLDLYSLAPQVFGTATATACIGSSTGVNGTFTGILEGTGFWGTTMGTGVNRVRICGIIGAGGTGVGGATGTQAFGLGTAVAFNPTYVNLAGATATIIVVSPAGTNTQAGYVFPIGVNGGLTMVPGDVFVVSRGTSSIGVYAVEVECTYTPGGNVTR